MGSCHTLSQPYSQAFSCLPCLTSDCFLSFFLPFVALAFSSFSYSLFFNFLFFSFPSSFRIFSFFAGRLSLFLFILSLCHPQVVLPSLGPTPLSLILSPHPLSSSLPLILFPHPLPSLFPLILSPNPFTASYSSFFSFPSPSPPFPLTLFPPPLFLLALFLSPPFSSLCSPTPFPLTRPPWCGCRATLHTFSP